MTTALITQSNYIPWKGYFDAVNLADVVVLYDEMQYTRRDWRNRNKIKTAQGVKWLTIPVQVKGKYHQKINQTEVSDPDWAQRHWTTIRHEYARAAHFDDVAPALAELYRRCGSESRLSSINRCFLEGICPMLGIEADFRWSADYELRGDRSEKLLNLCLDLGADRYLSGPAAQGYLDVDAFTRAGIEVVWLDYSGYPEYGQLHPPFEHGVSIVDLLLNEGPKAPRFLKSIDTA